MFENSEKLSPSVHLANDSILKHRRGTIPKGCQDYELPRIHKSTILHFSKYKSNLSNQATLNSNSVLSTTQDKSPKEHENKHIQTPVTQNNNSIQK